MNYRSDIDGLRAFCIIPVVLFHAGYPWITGGYVGVDSFFVISGFLITSMILKATREKTFSFSTFYYRRFRRLMPAAFVIYIVCVIYAILRLPPSLTQITGEQVLSSLFFFSNVYFEHKIDYFTGDALNYILLHTWSLSIEEQFYLIFPAMIVMVGMIWRKLIPALLILVTLTSFGFSCYFVERGETNLAYYATISRFWEIGLGSCLAVFAGVMPRLPMLIRLAALAVVIAIPFVYTDETPFPGYFALPTTLATALLLFIPGKQPDAIDRLLSFAPVVYLGRISYSWYLWHWVTFVIGYHEGYGDSARPVLIAVSLVLAIVSYHLVEDPVRRKSILPSAASFTPLLAVLVLAIVPATVLQTQAFGFVPTPLIETGRSQTDATLEGAPNLLEMTRLYDGWDESEAYRSRTCYLYGAQTVNDETLACLETDPGKYNIALIGDSNAAHFYHGLAKRFPDANIVQINSGACDPYRTLVTASGQNKSCEDVNKLAYERVMNNPDIDLFILSSRWKDDDIEAFRDMLEFVKDQGNAKKTLVIGRSAYFNRAPIQVAYGILNDSDAEALSVETLNGQIAETLKPPGSQDGLDTLLSEIAEGFGVAFISAEALQIVDGNYVFYGADGRPYYKDKGHFTDAGSAYVVATLFEQKTARQKLPRDLRKAPK